MIEQYRAELDAPAALVVRGSRGASVKRVQEWLCLHGRGVVIDSDFGAATERAVMDFQRGAGLEPTGKVNASTWDDLTADLSTASHAEAGMSFGAAVVAIAQGHLHAGAREVGGDNCGPWVRHYCRGFEVAWCQGFASTVWADAARLTNASSPLSLELDGIWCLFVPRTVTEARAKGLFVDGYKAQPTPGSMFFLRGGAYGYLHVGIVEATHDDGSMTTIEGNTNQDGSANGYEVARRIRRIQGSDFAVL